MVRAITVVVTKTDINWGNTLLIGTVCPRSCLV